MTIRGWNKLYLEIVKEFGYNSRLDYEAGIILNSIISSIKPSQIISEHTISSMIKNRTVFVIGAGNSLNTAIPTLKKSKGIVKIVADSATKYMTDCGIIPDIIITDLDGDAAALKRCSKMKSIHVVHAHGDNISKLYMATSFDKLFGTTQSTPYGMVRNFGGFTDGDRSVFLASHFGAKRIVLFGMDYDGTVGRFSGTKKSDKNTKLKKLNKSREILSWLSGRTKSELLTTSSHIQGFQSISYENLDSI